MMNFFDIQVLAFTYNQDYFDKPSKSSAFKVMGTYCYIRQEYKFLTNGKP